MCWPLKKAKVYNGKSCYVGIRLSVLNICCIIFLFFFLSSWPFVTWSMVTEIKLFLCFIWLILMTESYSPSITLCPKIHLPHGIQRWWDTLWWSRDIWFGAGIRAASSSNWLARKNGSQNSGNQKRHFHPSSSAPLQHHSSQYSKCPPIAKCKSSKEIKRARHQCGEDQTSEVAIARFHSSWRKNYDDHIW